MIGTSTSVFGSGEGQLAKNREFKTYCHDCGKRTPGTYRCEKCKAKHIKAWVAEGNSYSPKAYEGSYSSGKNMVEV